MPLPKPKPREEKKDFIQRCAADSIMNKEFPNESQRLAVCYSIWRDRNKHK